MAGLNENYLLLAAGLKTKCLPRGRGGGGREGDANISGTALIM